ncbi:MAG: hypothetical protein AAGC74_01770 [Verrucomicrobiota bacterium]
MNKSISALNAALLLSAATLQAAPSTPLPNEWFVPLENSNGYALVDTISGQVRFHEFDFAGNLTEIGPIETNLANITGLTSGFVESGTEHVVLSSTSANRVSIVGPSGAPPTFLFPAEPGPENAFLLTNTGDPGNPLLISSLLGFGGSGLELIDNPLTSQNQLDLISPLSPITSIQPLRDPVTGDHRGVSQYDIGPAGTVLELFRDGTSINGSVKLDNFTNGGILTTEVVGADGRICTISYVPGQTVTEVFTHSFGGFAENLVPSQPIPFPIGSIAPIPYGGIPNAPDGILITSQDGTTAVYAQVIPDLPLPTFFTFSIIETFSPSGPDVFNALLPVPGRGFVAFQGEPGNRLSTNWRYFRNTGSGWTDISSSALSPWAVPSLDFATLFWFDSTPLVDPMAELLKLEIVPDWTLGGGSLPASLATLERETFLNSASGLDSPTAYPASSPSGATYVLASQYQENASVSALADNFTLSLPSLAVSPDSDTYPEAVTVNLTFSEDTVEAFYRRSTDSTWTPYTTPLTIGYPTQISFYARDLASGKAGPIITRNYDFSVDITLIDSDFDGVPDFVEEDEGLDPAAGADTDLDFQSDLEEILGWEVTPGNYSTTDPNDPNSNIDAADRNPPYLGEGFFLYAQAYDDSSNPAFPFNDGGTALTPLPDPTDPGFDAAVAQQAIDRSDDTPGTNIFAADMRSTLLATGEVDTISSGPLTGNNAAYLGVGSSLPDREWLILSTPKYFDLGTTLPAPRNGRETFRVLQNPAFDLPTIAFVPTGTDRAADAAAWIAAARAAYSSFQPVTAITRIDPIDTAIAVLAEQALFDSLQTLSLEERTLLGVPAEIAEFTLFALRDGEEAKTPISQDMLDALVANGCDFTAMLTLLDSNARASGPILSLAASIYARHVAVSDTNPLMALPLDAWRSVLRNGNIADPAPGDPARTNPYSPISSANITTSQTEMINILDQIPGTKRPTEQWTLIIEAPTTPGHRYDYRRTFNNNLAWLVDAGGNRFILEQGLGLNLGSSFTVTGFIDVNPVTGFDTMEIISIDMVVTPTATDTDSNANCLDDDWELFFFGQLGAVGTYDAHPVSGHSYLQYHLSGTDPRSGSLSEPIYTLLPTNVEITWLPTFSAYDIEFDFPDAYVNSFTFDLHSSADLVTPFAGPVQNGTLTNLSPNRYALRATVLDSAADKNFFRVVMSKTAP